jgi:hypothetical protein
MSVESLLSINPLPAPAVKRLRNVHATATEDTTATTSKLKAEQKGH